MGSHTAQGALCTHCGNENHTADQCWKLHPELNPFAARQENANMMNLVNENNDINRRWEAEQQAREQRSLRYEKERDGWEKMKEERAEKGKEEDNDTCGRFQYMVDTRIGSVESSPERNEVAQEAERELRYMDQHDLLLLHPDETVNVNTVHVPPSPEDTVASWFTPPRRDVERALTRSGTQPRRLPRLDVSTSKTVHFEAPRSILKKPAVRRVRKDPSPLPPLSPPPNAVPEEPREPALAREIIVDKDAIQMPMSFPTQELEFPHLAQRIWTNR